MPSAAEFRELVTTSSLIPAEWRAQNGELTPHGAPALFPSNPHALMAIRLLYQAEVTKASQKDLDELLQRYSAAWRTYVAHGQHMQAIIALHEHGDLHATADAWRCIGQEKVDGAFRVMLGEREPPKARVTLARKARNHFGLLGIGDAVAIDKRDRKLTAADSDAAWKRSPGGVCRGCGTATISESQRARFHATFKKRPDLFDPTLPYEQHSGKLAPLWPQVTIAAKGVAEHIVPRSQGGRTTIANLTNVCAACNYSRGDTSIDAAGVADYDRPAEEFAQP